MFGPIKLLYYMMCANSYVSDMGYEEKRKKKKKMHLRYAAGGDYLEYPELEKELMLQFSWK